MSDAAPTDTQPPPAKRSPVKVALTVVGALLGIVALLAIAAVLVVRLRYDGPEPTTRVQVITLAPHAIATEGVAVDPDGVVHFADGQGYVYRLNSDDTAEVVLDLSGVPGGAGPPAICQIAFSPAGDLYIAHIGRSVLHRVEPDGTRHTMDADLEGPNFVAWHPAGYVFLTDSTRAVMYRYDPDGGNRVLITDAVGYPNGFAFTPDGKAILLNSCDSGRIYRIDLTADYRAAGPPVEVRFLGKHVLNHAILDGMLRLPDGDYLTCDFFGRQVIRFREDGTVVQRIQLANALDNKPLYPASLAQGPDGAIYVSNLGNVFTKDWGRGLYRFTLPPAP